MDRLFATEWLAQLETPVFTVGSSIGSWRFTALATGHPLDAIEAFEAAYIAQRYNERPSVAEVSRVSRGILDSFLSEDAIDEVLSHPVFRGVVMATRSRWPTAAENKLLQGTGLLFATAANLISRRGLSLFFDRCIFRDERGEPPFDEGALKAERFRLIETVLTRDNLKKSVLASGSIPMVLAGVTDIPGAPKGVYRDGAPVDYHLDVPFKVEDRDIILYPHFSNRVIPGWFDQKLPWRKPLSSNMANVVLICPSQSFIDALPFGQIPDRYDFHKFKGDDSGRMKYWKGVVASCRALADELHDLVESGSIRQRVEPFLSG
jgi:hypothetical protein